MSLFSKRKFSTFKFGATTLVNSRYGLAVDWDSDYLFDGTNEGENLVDLEINRGRRYTFSADGESFEVEETGKLSAVLIDEDSRYDPYNSSSPLYGNLAGGKFFKMRVRTSSDTYFPLMAGVLDEPVSMMKRGMSHARLEGSDGWAFLRDQKNRVTVALQEDIYADDAMALVLEYAGWPRIWDTALADGVDERSFFWVDARSAAQVMHELAHNELGQVAMLADGTAQFKSRVTLEDEVLELTDTDVMEVQKLTPREAIRNVLSVKSSPRTELSSQEVWEIPGRLEVAGSSTITDVWADFEYGGEAVPVKDPITPVSGTDYDAYENSDGTGADLTANITVAMTPFSTTGQLSITNGAATTAHVWVRVRGKPIAKQNTVSFNYDDDDSIGQFGPRPFTLQVDQNVNVARQYRDLLALWLPLARDYLVVDLMPEPDTQFAVDLGQVIRAKLSNYGIDRAYRVVRIRHKFHDEAGIVMMTRWWLEPYSRLFAGVQLPVQVPFQLGGG